MAYRFYREAYDEADADNATLRTLLHQRADHLVAGQARGGESIRRIKSCEGRGGRTKELDTVMTPNAIRALMWGCRVVADGEAR